MTHTMNSKDLIRELLKDGWVLDRVNDSHHIYKHPQKTGHLSAPIQRGTLVPG